MPVTRLQRGDAPGIRLDPVVDGRHGANRRFKARVEPRRDRCQDGAAERSQFTGRTDLYRQIENCCEDLEPWPAPRRATREPRSLGRGAAFQQAVDVAAVLERDTLVDGLDQMGHPVPCRKADETSTGVRSVHAAVEERQEEERWAALGQSLHLGVAPGVDGVPIGGTASRRHDAIDQPFEVGGRGRATVDQHEIARPRSQAAA